MRWNPALGFVSGAKRAGLPALFRCVRDQTQCACPSAELARCACAPVFSRSPRQVTSWSAAWPRATPTRSRPRRHVCADHEQWFRLQEVRAREPVYSRQSQVVSQQHFGRRFCGEHHVFGPMLDIPRSEKPRRLHRRRRRLPTTNDRRIPSDLRLKTDDCILTCTHPLRSNPSNSETARPRGQRECVRPRTSAARSWH